MGKLKSLGRFLTALALAAVLSFGAVVPAHAVAWEAVVVEAILGGVIESLISAAIVAASPDSSDTEVANAKEIANRYWRYFSAVPPDEEYDIEVSADVLSDIAAELCLSGFPCQVVPYNGNYYIKGVGDVYIPDVIDYSDRNGFGGDEVYIYGKYFSHEGLYYYSTTMPSSYLLDQIRTTLTNISSAITSISSRLSTVVEKLTTTNTTLSGISNGITVLQTSVDGLSQLLYTTYKDENGDEQVESVAQKLDRLIAAVDPTPITDELTTIASKLTTINSNLLASSGDTTYTIAELTRNLWTAQKNANTALTTLTGHVDGLEGSLKDAVTQLTTANTKLTTLAGYLDGVENSLTAISGKLTTINSNLLYKNADGSVYNVAEQLAYIRNKLQTTYDGTTYTIAELTRNVWTAQKNANTALTTLTGHVDGLEGSMKDAVTQLTTANTKLTTLAGYLDGVENSLTTISGKLTTINSNLLYKNGETIYTVAELLGYMNNKMLVNYDGTTYTISELVRNVWLAQKNGNELLTALSGFVDGLEAGILSGNALTENIGSTVVKMDSTLSGVLQWLKIQTYGEQDIYSLMSNMVYSYYYGDAATRANIETIWDRYWQEEETALASTLAIRINADQLREMQRQFNEIGIPTIVKSVIRGDSSVSVLVSQGAVRIADIDDFGKLTIQFSGLNEYPRVFVYNGFLYYSTEDTTSNGIAALNGKLTTVVERLDTLIDGQDGNLSADVTVDLGDVTLSTDDTVLAAYLKMIAYGQQDMYSILGTIAGEYRDATDTEKAAMDKILMKYWRSPGSHATYVTISGDQLRDIRLRMVELGYPCEIVKASGADYYVIKVFGWPRVSDVFDYNYTGEFSGLGDFTGGQTYYLTQGGVLLRSYGVGTENMLESMTSQLTTMVTGQTAILSRLDTIIEHLSANIGDGGCSHVYVSQIEQEQTCVLPGLQTFTCDECGSSYSEILDSLGHDWQCTDRVAEQTDPVSGEVLSQSYDVYTCSRCEDTYNDYEGTGAPEAESNTIAGLIGRVFEKLGSLAGELLGAVIRMLDRLVTGFDELVTDFNEKAQQVSSFGGDYPKWLAGAWDILPSELQLAMSFCVVMFCVGILGKHLFFTTS